MEHNSAPAAWSKSQINTLGDRLRKHSPPSEEDLSSLGQIRFLYFSPLIEIFHEIHTIDGITDCVYSCRLKNTHTIIEKLCRDQTRLSKMQDIAGIRIVMSTNDRNHQNKIADLVKNHTSLKNIEIDDRRIKPSFGYRAIHMRGEHQQRRIEISIR